MNNQQVSLEQYESRSRHIIQMVDKLRDEGAPCEIDLPTVVFCGNQSAGKSSLIEAISSINLPRSDGTCTRCPMELRLSDTPEEWRCSISLQIKYDNDGNLKDKVQDYMFVQDITEMDQVEIYVRRAQKAILNPCDSYDSYKTYEFDDSTHENRMYEVENNQLKFTMNTVCLKITGSSVNLTLIDLPGIIRSTETAQDAGFIRMVEDMVKKHIKNPRALIIATISCKDEIENQAIIALAKEADPEGARTIGVLTKPDTIEQNCHDTWIQVLNNSRFQLRLGYFVIKNPSKKELDSAITFKEARKNETLFFSSTRPWSCASSQLKSRMGVNNLRNALSLQLTELIEASLPVMKATVYDLINQVSKSLDALPDPVVQNPKIEIHNLIKSFGMDIRGLIEARDFEKEFYRSIETHFKVFSKELSCFRPLLVLPKNKLDDKIEVNTDEFIIYGDKTLDSHFTPENIKDIIDKQRGRDFPQFNKSEAFQKIIKACQKNWHENTKECIRRVKEDLSDRLIEQVKVHFNRFKKLSSRVESLVDDLILNCYQETYQKLNYLFSMEANYPITVDSSRMDRLIEHIHNELEIPLNFQELKGYTRSSNEDINDCIYSLSNVGIETTKKQLPRLISNLFDEKVRNMLEISQAYYQVASSRYVDMVSMTIFNSLVQDTSISIVNYLNEKLQLFENDDGLAASLIEEAPAVAAHRDDFNRRLRHLRELRKTLS